MTKLEEKMVKIYASLVLKDEKSIDDVPKNLKNEVEKILNE